MATTPGTTHLDLGRRERQIVETVYRLGQATVGEVLDQLPDPPSYSAVRATLGKLQRKGYLTHVQDGPRYVYRPVVPSDRARKTALKHVINTFFNGSVEQAVVALLRLSESRLTETDLKRLAERIAQASREGR